MGLKLRPVVIAALFASIFVFSGCFNKEKRGEKKPSKEEAWVLKFKAKLAKTEQRFFQSRFVQRSDDPFFLNDVLSKAQAAGGKGLSKELKAQLDARLEDFEESWPVLTSQLERIQNVFAVVGVLPAYQASLLLAKTTMTLDPEVAAAIAELKVKIEAGTVFNGEAEELELVPQTGERVLELADKIAARTLALVANALKGDLDPKARAQLTTWNDEIRLFNPRAAEAAGQRVEPGHEPYIDDPLKVWADLKSAYDGIFDALRGLLKPNGGTPNWDELRISREKEAKLLTSLQFATEKQFKIATVITRPE